MMFLFQRWDMDSFPGRYGLLLPFNRKQKWWYLKTCCLPTCVVSIWFPSKSMLAYLLVGQVVPSTINETHWITVNTCSNLRTNTIFLIQHVICTYIYIYNIIINIFLFVHIYLMHMIHMCSIFLKPSHHFPFFQRKPHPGLSGNLPTGLGHLVRS